MAASPQCENGYTKIANELFDAIIRTGIPGQEMRIMLAVMRLTYGYGKTKDQISYGQLSKITGIPRPRVIEHVKSLVSKKRLGSLNNGTRKPLTMWINKDYLQWLPSLVKETSLIGGTIPSLVFENRSSLKYETLQRKKEIKRNKGIEIPEWISPELWKEFLSHRAKLKKPMTDYAQKLMFKKLEFHKSQGHNPEHLIKEAMVKGWQDVYPPSS